MHSEQPYASWWNIDRKGAGYFTDELLTPEVECQIVLCSVEAKAFKGKAVGGRLCKAGIEERRDRPLAESLYDASSKCIGYSVVIEVDRERCNVGRRCYLFQDVKTVAV